MQCHGDRDPCPLADKALFQSAFAEASAATGQVAERASSLKQIPSIRARKLAEFSERSAQGAAMPALDLRRGRRAFRAVEDDAEGVTIDADNSKARMPDRWLRSLRGF